MTTAVHLQGLHKSYSLRNHAVRNLNLEVPEGCFMGFFGPNGAGKTTTIKLMLNLLQPSAGLARVLGKNSRSLGIREFQRIGYVSENQEMPDWMTLQQLLAYCQPMYPNWDETLCERLRERFQLPLDQKLSKMSRGMRMKAALLSSLSYRPGLVVLDEPFSGLDPLSRDQFVDGLMELAEEHPYTLFLSTHDVDEVERLCDTVAFIREGSLHLTESTDSLLNRFRRVEATMPENGGGRRDKSIGDLQLRQSGSRISGLESHFTTMEEAELRLKTIYPDAKGIQYDPMRLRDIIVHLSEESTA